MTPARGPPRSEEDFSGDADSVNAWVVHPNMAGDSLGPWSNTIYVITPFSLERVPMSFSNNYLVLTDPFLGEEIVYGRPECSMFTCNGLNMDFGYSDNWAMYPDQPKERQSQPPQHADWESTLPFKEYATKSSDGIDLPKMILFPPERLKMTWNHVFEIGAGLQNMGNTCYVNAILQCLTYTPPFANYMLSQEHSKKCFETEFCVMCAMQQHVILVFANSGKVIKPITVLRGLNVIAEHFHTGRQEDAHEFLRCTVEAMQRSCLPYSFVDRPTQTTTFIHQTFGGYLRSRITCMNCNGVSDTFDPFLDISLEIENAPTLNEALEQFVRPEILGGENAYKCDRCNNMTTAIKGFTIHRSANVLTLALKRFDFLGAKISKDVKYPEYLNLQPFLSQSSGEPQLYRLYAVLVHSGTDCRAGHYYCYVKGSTGDWYEMNDSSVSISDSWVALSQQAYLLFYIRWTNPGVPRCYTPMEQDPAILSQNSQLQMGIPQCNATGDSDIDLSLHRQLIEWSKRLYIGLGKGELSFVPSQSTLHVNLNESSSASFTSSTQYYASPKSEVSGQSSGHEKRRSMYSHQPDVETDHMDGCQGQKCTWHTLENCTNHHNPCSSRDRSPQRQSVRDCKYKGHCEECFHSQWEDNVDGYQHRWSREDLVSEQRRQDHPDSEGSYSSDWNCMDKYEWGCSTKSKKNEGYYSSSKTKTSIDMDHQKWQTCPETSNHPFNSTPWLATPGTS